MKSSGSSPGGGPKGGAGIEGRVEDKTLAVLNKGDLLADQAIEASFGGKPALKISCTTGEGLSVLLARIEDFLEAHYLPPDSPVLTRSRHRHALEKCLESLRRYDIDAGEELAAEELRLAADCLARITGRSDTDQVLYIFSNAFCFGKCICNCHLIVRKSVE